MCVLYAGIDEEKTSEYDLKLMRLDTEHLGIPDQPYDAMVGMGAVEFQKLVRDLSSLSDSSKLCMRGPIQNADMRALLRFSDDPRPQ